MIKFVYDVKQEEAKAKMNCDFGEAKRFNAMIDALLTPELTEAEIVEYRKAMVI